MPGGIVIQAELILRPGLAVDNMALAARERLQKVARFLREGMLVAVTRSVQPPDLARGAADGERMQHREYGSGPDAGAHQDDRRIARPQA